jgi:hypothetical protein
MQHEALILIRSFRSLYCQKFAFLTPASWLNWCFFHQTVVRHTSANFFSFPLSAFVIISYWKLSLFKIYEIATRQSVHYSIEELSQDSLYCWWWVKSSVLLTNASKGDETRWTKSQSISTTNVWIFLLLTSIRLILLEYFKNFLIKEFLNDSEMVNHSHKI